MSSTFELTDYMDSFRKEMNDMRRNNICTDVTIICNGQKFPAHKFILRIGSSCFRKMFDNDFKESNSNVVELPNIDSDVFSDILDFLYLSYTEKENCSNTKFTALLKAAHYLDIPKFYEYCWRKLLGKLNINSYSHLWNLGLLYDKKDIVEEVLDFIVSHLYDVMQSKPFFDLTPIQIENLVKRIAQLKIPIETFIMERIINWVRNNEEERSPSLRKLISYLDITTLPLKYLNQLMATEPFFINDKGLRFTINKKLKDKSHSQTHEENTLRQTYQMLRFMHQYNISRYQYIDLDSGEKKEDNLSFLFTKGMSCAQSEHLIYFVGGKATDGSPYSKTFLQFCLESNTAEYLPPIPKPVSYAHTCVVNRIFYVLAGTQISQNTGKKYEPIQYYNPDTEKWSETDFPQKIIQVKLCANLDKTLFILCEKDEICFQMYKINENMKCVLECEMPYVFSLSSNLSASYNDCLYSLVSCENQTLLCIYCSLTKKWTTRHFEGEMPEFVYCVMRNGDDCTLFCLYKENVYALDSQENKIRPLRFNSVANVGFCDDLPIDVDQNSVCLNFGYVKPSQLYRTNSLIKSTNSAKTDDSFKYKICSWVNPL